MLAVAASARTWAALPEEEDTLSRELGTPPLPEAHFPVGYCWQNSRCCRPLRGPQHSHIGDFVSHPNDQAQRIGPPSVTLIVPTRPAAGRVRCGARSGEIIPRSRDTQVSADLANQGVRHLRVAWDRRSPAVRRIAPPRVPPARPDRPTALLLEVADQVVPLQRARLTSSNAPAAAARASSRFISKASSRASRKLSSSSSRVAAWEFTPGTSSTQPIHHWSCRWMMAV